MQSVQVIADEPGPTVVQLSATRMNGAMLLLSKEAGAGKGVKV